MRPLPGSVLPGFTRPVLTLLLLIGLGGAPALAAGPTCQQTQTQCDRSCAGRYETEAGKVGCQTRCATERAACDAKAGYDTAKPWLQRQKKSMEEFLDGLGGGQSAPPPAKTKDNSEKAI